MLVILERRESAIRATTLFHSLGLSVYSSLKMFALAYLLTVVDGRLPGDYLMRESGSSAGFVLSVNDFGTVVNYPIEVEAELDEDGDATSDEVFKFMGLQFYSLEASAHCQLSFL